MDSLLIGARSSNQKQILLIELSDDFHFHPRISLIAANEIMKIRGNSRSSWTTISASASNWKGVEQINKEPRNQGTWNDSAPGLKGSLLNIQFANKPDEHGTRELKTTDGRGWTQRGEAAATPSPPSDGGEGRGEEEESASKIFVENARTFMIALRIKRAKGKTNGATRFFGFIILPPIILPKKYTAEAWQNHEGRMIGPEGF